ncbi:hypothetical protein ACK3TF_005208 [Chlorella vulgaris]
MWSQKTGSVGVAGDCEPGVGMTYQKAAAGLCLVACAAACTSILLVMDRTLGRHWIDVCIVGFGLVSAACALATAGRHLRSSGSSSSNVCGSTRSFARLGRAAALLGAAAHVALLVTLTVYWRFFATRTYYKFYGGRKSGTTVEEMPVNHFRYFHRWTDEEMALFAFGAVGGAAVWILALAVDALGSWRAAVSQRSAAADAKLSNMLSSRAMASSGMPGSSSDSNSIHINSMLGSGMLSSSVLSSSMSGGSSGMHSNSMLGSSTLSSSLFSNSMLGSGMLSSSNSMRSSSSSTTGHHVNSERTPQQVPVIDESAMAGAPAAMPQQPAENAASAVDAATAAAAVAAAALAALAAPRCSTTLPRLASSRCGGCILRRLAAKPPTSLEAVRSALEGLRSSLERQLADRHAV